MPLRGAETMSSKRRSETAVSGETNANRRCFLKAAGSVGAASMVGLAGCAGESGGGGGGGGDGGGGDGGDGGSGGGGNNLTQWSITGSQEGSPANVWAQGFAAVMEEHSDKLRLSPKPYSDWLGALALTSEGSEDLVMSWAHNCFQAQNDIKKFAPGGDIGPVDPKPQMTLPVIHQGYWWVGTHANRDDIETIADLDGKKVATQLPGAAPSTWFESCLNEVGAKPSQLSFMPFPDAASAMQSRKIDASLFLAINGAIIPAPTQQAFQAVEVKGVEIPEDALEAVKKNEWQTMQWTTVKNENFNVKAAPPEKFGEVTSFLMASGNHIHSTADPDLVYDYVKTILDNQDSLGEYHAALNLTGIGEGRHNFQGVPEGLEFHEGAVRYYEEEGIDYPGSGN